LSHALAVAGGTVPLLELSLAIGLLLPATAWWSAAVAIGLLFVFVTAIGANVVRGRAPDCHCFGQLHSAPAGWDMLLRNVVSAAVGGVAVVAGTPPADWARSDGWHSWRCRTCSGVGRRSAAHGRGRVCAVSDRAAAHSWNDWFPTLADVESAL